MEFTLTLEFTFSSQRRGCEGGGLSYLFEGVNEVKTMWLGSLVTKNKEAC